MSCLPSPTQFGSRHLAWGFVGLAAARSAALVKAILSLMAGVVTGDASTYDTIIHDILQIGMVRCLTVNMTTQRSVDLLPCRYSPWLLSRVKRRYVMKCRRFYLMKEPSGQLSVQAEGRHGVCEGNDLHQVPW